MGWLEQLPKQRYCILPPKALLLGEFAEDHPLREKHLSRARKMFEKGSDGNQEIMSCYSMETSPNQSIHQKNKEIHYAEEEK